MNLDLEKLKKLSKTADLSRSTGKYSHIYNELDKAWDVISDLILTKRVTHKTVIKLLQESGMTELKAHNFSGWWLNTKNTAKKKLLKAAKESISKKPPMAGIASTGKLTKKFE